MIIKSFFIFLANIIHLFRAPVSLSAEDSALEPERPQLQKNDAGLEVCIGCALCAAYCPLEIITVRAAENSEDNSISDSEAYARIFQIEGERCINCGYCEEACLPEAIIVTGANSQAVEDRGKLRWKKTHLLDRE